MIRVMVVNLFVSKIKEISKLEFKTNKIFANFTKLYLILDLNEISKNHYQLEKIFFYYYLNSISIRQKSR